MRQAVIILHGMGEQIPMQTLNTFVRSVWSTDRELVVRDRPDPNTGGRRIENACWAKPDPRNSSTELRRITTESDRRGNYTDFYEFYWAHLMHGTTWEHVQSWIMDLLLRNPLRRVPRSVLHAWLALWLIVLIAAFFAIRGMLPADDGEVPAWRIIASGLGGVAVAAFVSNVLIKRFGDVARYVKAKPPNVARRQEIRAEGVALLDRLMSSGEYDRIVVVAHSLGTIVAYDVLSMLFARYNNVLDDGGNVEMQQPERHLLEEMIRRAAGFQLADGTCTAAVPLDVDAYQTQQAKVMAEARAQGSRWIVSDFVTLGAPLTHAEFLMAESHEDLRNRQSARLLPTCPPVLEFDGTTKLRHVTYDPRNTEGRAPTDRRVPHHAALFAQTRWTNLYSQERGLVMGDLISGPVGEAFGLEVETHVVRGIRDISVLPCLDEAGRVAKGHRRSFFSHNNYWRADKGTETGDQDVPHHIAELRTALGLLV